MPFRHRFRVRYVDCDAQRVMHNAHYLAYVDDAVDTWFRDVLGDYVADGFDIMVKKATIEWRSPARLGETVDCSCSVVRWGTSSFDVEVRGAVDDRAVFDAVIVYVSTVPGEARAAPVPPGVRQALSG